MRYHQFSAGIILTFCTMLLTSCTQAMTPAPTSLPSAQTSTQVSPVTPSEATLGDTQIRMADSAVMIFVPGGEFLMGSTEKEVDSAFVLCEQYRGAGLCMRAWFENEVPAHEVTLNSFWIDRTEVTNQQYDRCVKAGVCNPAICLSEFPIHELKQPVGCVNWSDAQTFCEWAGARLPTEAEWEYAARGFDRLTFPWGNDFDPSRLNYCDTNCTYKWRDFSYDDGYSWPAPVGSFMGGESWSGALDMAGNNWEWVSDWYDPGYYAVSPAEDPLGPATGTTRVYRGGSAHYFPPYVRSARRDGLPEHSVYASGGFRCAVSD